MGGTRGKLCESIKLQTMATPRRLTMATGMGTCVWYNGMPATVLTRGVGIDTAGYDDVVVALAVGSTLGALATLSNALYANSTDDPWTASLITGASFTDANAAHGDTGEWGSVRMADQKRYLFLKTTLQGDLNAAGSATVDFAALCILGNPDVQACPSTSLIFDV